MKRTSLKVKIAGLNIISVFTIVAIFLAITIFQKTKADRVVGTELNKLIDSNIGSICRDIYNQVEALNGIMSSEVDVGLNVTRSLVNKGGNIRFHESETVEWDAINQLTKESVYAKLPKVMLGNQWLGKNTAKDTPSPLVDEVFQIAGGTATVFQKMNKQGDMLRVCTNIIKKDGTRAVGTFVPAFDTDGKPNPIIKTVMEGKTFKGRAFVVDAWYLTAYEPVLNDQKEVVGLIYYGIRQEKTQALRKGIMKTLVGKTGYVYVLNAKGATKGYYVISKDGKRDGEDIYNAKDSDGRLFIQSIVEKALILKEGGMDFERYPWLNEGETEPRWKKVAITYFEPWDWIIAAGAYEDDFKSAQTGVDNALTAIVKWGLISALLSLGLVVFMALYLTGKITNPLNLMVDMVKDMAEGEGDLTKSIHVDTNDEVHDLGDWFNTYIMKLKEIIIKIRSASVGIHNAMEEVSQESTDLADRTNEQAASITQTSTTLEEFTQTVKLNAESSAEAEMMLQTMDHEMKTKGELMTNVTGTMSAIYDSSKKIDNIVNVINDISFQTNLLALNAAVEAARAGEAGRGFAVVAAEVRNLAQKTAESSKSIQEIVSSNVEATQKGMELVKQTSAFFNEITTIMDEMVGKVNDISNSSREQQTGIEQINQAIIHLDEVSNQNATLVEALSTSTKDMKTNTAELEEMVEKFILD